jgi:predicted transcriptional regulator
MPDPIHLTAKLVAAYLRKNHLATGDIVNLIRSTYATVADTASPEPAPVERPQPAVAARKSVTPDVIICLDCGSPQKMLKRHIGSAHGLTVDEYRAKWSLGADYPMVAPNYAAHRSELAIKIGLGHSRKQPKEQAAPAEVEVEVEESNEPKPRHRYPASRWSRPSE